MIPANVGAPSGDVGIEKLAECRRRPGKGVHAVGDGADIVGGKHSAGNFAVAHGDAVHVSGKTQRQKCHVERVVLPCVGFVEQREFFASQDLPD